MTQKILTEQFFVKTVWLRRKRQKRGHSIPMCHGINGKGCLATPENSPENESEYTEDY